MVLHRPTGTIEHRRVSDLTHYLRAGDLLMANDSRVIPARLTCSWKPTGGRAEIFHLRQVDDAGTSWSCLVRGPQARTRRKTSSDAWPAQTLGSPVISSPWTTTRSERCTSPSLSSTGLANSAKCRCRPILRTCGGDPERYQTVFSRTEGSVAAPTAGLHFSPELLMDLRQHGVLFDTLTLHVGLDTFQPVNAEEIEGHRIHTEWAELDANVARRINDVVLRGGRIVAVGTTTVRTLEWSATGAQGIAPYGSEACPWKRTVAFASDVNLFIRPGYRFRAVDMLLTNFHLPKSSLLMLVSAFVGQAFPEDPDVGRLRLLAAYAEAIKAGYRFFSFGDAMLIV